MFFFFFRYFKPPRILCEYSDFLCKIIAPGALEHEIYSTKEGTDILLDKNQETSGILPLPHLQSSNRCMQNRNSISRAFCKQEDKQQLDDASSEFAKTRPQCYPQPDGLYEVDYSKETNYLLNGTRKDCLISGGYPRSVEKLDHPIQ